MQTRLSAFILSMFLIASPLATFAPIGFIATVEINKRFGHHLTSRGSSTWYDVEWWTYIGESAG